MDPFSLTAGSVSLLQLSVQLGQYLKDVYDTATSFEEDIGSLILEVRDLESVNALIERFHTTEVRGYTAGQSDVPQEEKEIWQNTINTLQSCSKAVKRLQHVLQSIIGKNGLKVTGLRDGIRKALRKQAKDGELKEIRLQLSSHRESLSLCLNMFNVIYTRKGSREAQNFGFQLLKQLTSLQSRLLSDDANDLHRSVRSATAIASALHLNKHFDTPKTVSSIFTGREVYLTGLKQAYNASHALSEDKSVSKRFVVYGIGGSGKTQFCCKFALENKQRFWGVFTVDASKPENAKQSFIAIAKACGTDPNERAAKSWLSSSDRPWLLLIDNADDAMLEIEKYFPDGEQGLTLITTRNPSVKIHGTIGEGYYHFDRLDNEEANELLLRAADNHEPRTPAILRLASAITMKLGALPLALVHAGRAIKAKLCDLANYNSYYERSWQLIRQNQRISGQDEDDSEYMKVYASYEIVFRGLEAVRLQRYRDAVQLLRLFSFLHHEHIPFEFLMAAVKHPRLQREADAASELSNQLAFSQPSMWHVRSWPRHFRTLIELIVKKQFFNENPLVLPTFLRDAELSSNSDDFNIRLRAALLVLTESSLITYYDKSDSYSMHPLVHTWVRERPEMTARAQAVWCEAALHTLSRCILLPPLSETVNSHGNLARKLLPHIISVGKLQQKIEQEFLSNRKQRSRPWPVLQTKLCAWRAIFLAKSALVYSECGNFEEAEACLRIVLDFNIKFLGPNHPRTERVALVVSDCLWQEGRVKDAADLQEQYLQQNLRTLGATDPRTLRLMDKLGESRRNQARFAESMELLTQAVDGMKSQLPASDPAIYHALEQLGITMRCCFCLEDARQNLEQARVGMEACLGKNDMRTLITVEELAITYKDLATKLLTSNHQLARHYLKIAHEYATFVLEQRREQIGDQQPHTWIAQGNLGRIKAAMGDIAAAEQIYSTILPVAIRHLGDHHLGVLNHKTHYARILMQQKRYQEAEALLVDVSKLTSYRITSLTGDHPDRWDALWTLIECYQNQGKTSRALETCNELINAIKRVRDGEEQTESSSAFWTMVLDRRRELMAIDYPDFVKDAKLVVAKALSNNSTTAELDSGVHTASTAVQVVVKTGAEEFRLRESTKTW